MASSEPTRKKNKRSFLYKARKFAKKGQYGRGHAVEEDSYQYFVRVAERLRDEFTSDEERDIFVANVFTQTEGTEVDLSCNQMVSRVLEKLLPLASDEDLARFTTSFGNDLRLVCVDAFASHVLQTLLQIASKKRDKATFSEWVSKVGRFVLNNLEEFAWHTYANHVARTTLTCLSGVDIDDKVIRSRRARHQPPAENVNPVEASVEPLSTVMILEFTFRLMTWPQFSELVESDLTSGLVQTLLLILPKIDPSMCEKFVNFVIKEFLNSGGVEKKRDETCLLPCFENESSIHTLEVTLSVASPESYSKIFNQCFKGRLLILSQHPIAYFAVQKLLCTCADKEQLEAMFTELGDNLEDILASGHAGVVVYLAQACQRVGAKQSGFLKCVMTAFHCWEPVERQAMVVLLLARLVTYDIWQKKESDQKFPVTLHGSLLLQAMMQFSKPIKFVHSLLSLPPSEVKDLAEDQRGSHIFDAFVKSQFIGEKSRDKLIQHLKGQMVALACSKHGSRTLDALWGSSSLKMKATIAEELAAKQSLLSANPFGKYMVQNYGLWLFKHRNAEWKEGLSRELTTRKMFKDIIGDTGEPKPKKQKKEKVEES